VERTELQSLCTELVSRGLSELAEEGKCHENVMGLVERELILQILRGCQGTQTKAATRLGINRNTLHKKIEDFGLQSEAR
jgi:DNA-binding protein Fis